MNKKKKQGQTKIISSVIAVIAISIYGMYGEKIYENLFGPNITSSYDMSSIPAYADRPYVIINNNKPEFDEKDYTTTSFESYSDLDLLERCGVAYANIGKDLMPTEERGSIGMIKPSGWHTVKYDNVDGKYLYNRCHLIGLKKLEVMYYIE